MKTSIPKKLIDIVEYIKKENLSLTANNSDGRVNSLVNEGEILRLIQNKFDINLPKSRAGFDFSFEDNDVFIPVNVKVTTTTTADNLNCKLGIYYALTGLMPSFSNGISYDKYFEILKKNLNENSDRDYFFLVVNKDNPKDVFANSLKGLKSLQPNGNNLPFQCKWDDNRVFCNRTFDQAKDFLLSVFGQSTQLRAEAYKYFKEAFPQYV
ncbi:MAG: hypothetical protein LBM25_03185 [Bacteroidales bacterium]|jgi:hypothetical protein|nr:hypothetical protein [Bacteroidales bacterium]